jgi:hypothetical protein
VSNAALPSSTTRWRSNPNALHNHSIIRGASRYRRHGMIVLVMIGAELLGHRKSKHQPRRDAAALHLGPAVQSQTWMRGLYQMPRYPSQTGAPRVQ